jgi:CRP-like cAMP-binding protein
LSFDRTRNDGSAAPQNHVTPAALEIRSQLRTVPFFSDVLQTRHLDELASVCEARVFKPGSVLMRQGDIGNSMFCIIEGVVQVVYESGRRQRSEIIRLREGSVVGEMEVLSAQPRLATVLALTDVRALEIPSATLKALLSRSSELEESLRATLTRRHAIYSEVTTSQAPLLQRLVAKFKTFRLRRGRGGKS